MALISSPSPWTSSLSVMAQQGLHGTAAGEGKGSSVVEIGRVWGRCVSNIIGFCGFVLLSQMVLLRSCFGVPVDHKTTGIVGCLGWLQKPLDRDG